MVDPARGGGAAGQGAGGAARLDFVLGPFASLRELGDVVVPPDFWEDAQQQRAGLQEEVLKVIQTIKQVLKKYKHIKKFAPSRGRL